jgi:hypothetical protein
LKKSKVRPPDERVRPFLDLYAEMVADRMESKLAEPREEPPPQQQQQPEQLFVRPKLSATAVARIRAVRAP